MKTSIELNDDLFTEAQRVLGTGGIKATIEASLKAVIQQHHRERLADALGTLDGLQWPHQELPPHTIKVSDVPR